MRVASLINIAFPRGEETQRSVPAGAAVAVHGELFLLSAGW
jgi:hypothetical protein